MEQHLALFKNKCTFPTSFLHLSILKLKTMKKILFFLIPLTFLFSCKSEKTNNETVTKTENTEKEVTKDGQAKYSASAKEAMSLYNSKEFEKSAMKFEEAFDALNGKAYPNDRYNASCSYSLSGNSEKAFYHLFKLAKDAKYSNLSLIHI